VLKWITTFDCEGDGARKVALLVKRRVDGAIERAFGVTRIRYTEKALIFETKWRAEESRRDDGWFGAKQRRSMRYALERAALITDHEFSGSTAVLEVDDEAAERCYLVVYLPDDSHPSEHEITWKEDQNGGSVDT
jgi:hypothetical protein